MRPNPTMPRGLAEQFGRVNPVSKRPVAGPGRGIGLGDFARQGDKPHGDVFGDRLDRRAGRVDHVNPAFGRRVNVDVVNPNAVPTDDLEARCPIHDRAVDDASSACENAICVFDRGDDLIGFKSLGPDDLAVVFQEVVLPTGMDGFKEQDVEFCQDVFLSR